MIFFLGLIWVFLREIFIFSRKISFFWENKNLEKTDFRDTIAERMNLVVRRNERLEQTGTTRNSRARGP